MTACVLSPGEFAVADDPSTILQTTLGSCVAVALWDPQVRVGGMIHVLLPEGSEEKEKLLPWRYARSAVPMLLSEMHKRGAKRDRIVAVIAGGALMLIDRVLSIEMNIGEKNSQMVQHLLQRNGIPVLTRDLGGHCARVFKLKVGTGDVHVQRIALDREEHGHTHADSKLGYCELKLKLNKLRPLPDIARRIISALDTLSLSDLEREISKDQALTANILKVCNSAYYGFRHQIASLRRACALLGINTLKRIILSVSFSTYFGDSMRGYSTKKGDLTKHSFSCALIAALIAEEKRIPEVDVVFTAGLLHDIGKVVLDQYAFERYSLIMDSVRNGPMSFLSAENRILGFNHAQVGGMMAQEWHLPAPLSEAISLHHQPEFAQINSKLVSVVHIADNITSMFGEGCGLDELANQINASAVSTLNLRSGEVERIVERLPDVLRQLESL